MAKKRANLKYLRDEMPEFVVNPAAKRLKRLLGRMSIRLKRRGKGMNLNADGGGKSKSSQRGLQSTSARALIVLDSSNSDDDENITMVELKEHEEGEESASSKAEKHLVQGHEPISLVDDDSQLIGDLTKPCALPCLPTGTQYPDLKTISGDTLARLIQGEFVDQLGPGGVYQIIDCRYPYKFAGGHIRGARNLYEYGQIQKAFPSLKPQKEVGRRIYVFYSEFSAQKGPKLLRFLRFCDRRKHIASYPALDYPELYLLHGGYKEFYGSHGNLCEPCENEELLSRTKSKGEGGGRIRIRTRPRIRNPFIRQGGPFRIPFP